MRETSKAALSLFAGALCLALAHAASAVSFSATFSTTSKAAVRGPMDMDQAAQIWVSEEKVRTESLDQGHVMAHIVDTAKHTNYLMVPDQGFYEDDSGKEGVMPALPRSAPAKWAYDAQHPCGGEVGASCEKTGSETVGGRSCDNWKFTQGERSWTSCLDKKTGIVLRNVVGDRTFELSSLKVGKQDPKLFELSPDLKKGGFTKPTSGRRGGGPPGAPPGAGPGQ